MKVVLDEDGCLECPGCKNQYIHHGKVEVYFRRMEDDRVSRCVTILENDTINEFIASNPNNPSMRRDGVRISFSCENCTVIASLLVIQHKGRTFVEWEK